MPAARDGWREEGNDSPSPLDTNAARPAGAWSAPPCRRTTDGKPGNPSSSKRSGHGHRSAVESLGVIVATPKQAIFGPEPWAGDRGEDVVALGPVVMRGVLHPPGGVVHARGGGVFPS